MRDKSRWTEADIPSQAGRTALITGANTGLGFMTALALARSGARVFLGCRDLRRGAEAGEAVGAAATGPEPELIEIDLADQACISRAAQELDSRTDQLHLLVNNAGVASSRARTADGHDIHFGVNHLGAFALTARVLPVLLRAADSRVVTVSSLVHWVGRIRWDDLGWDRGRYPALRAYASSKLANLLFATELDRRAKASGTGLRSVAAHPGITRTSLGRQMGALQAPMIDLAGKLFGQPDVAIGVLPQLRAATDPRLRGGEYIGPGGACGIRGAPGEARRSRVARDPGAAARLWQVSEALTGTPFRWKTPNETRQQA